MSASPAIAFTRLTRSISIRISPISIRPTRPSIRLSIYPSIYPPFILYTMGLKRKRSIDVSPSTSTSSFLSSPSRTSTSPCPDPHQYYDQMDIEAPIANSTFSSWGETRRESLSSRLNSRTRKRFRDNRPDEEMIHGKIKHETRLLACSILIRIRKHISETLLCAATISRQYNAIIQLIPTSNPRHRACPEVNTSLLLEHPKSSSTATYLLCKPSTRFRKQRFQMRRL